MFRIIEKAGLSGDAASCARKQVHSLLLAALAVVLTLAPVSAADWKVTPLHAFDTAVAAQGIGPRGSLAVDAKGVVYGTTESGGVNGVGTIFQVARDTTGKWKFTRLFSFVAAKGSLPQSGLVLGKDGALYGTTTRGGSKGGGTVYQFRKVAGVWTFTVLHHFNLPAGEGTGNRAALAFDKTGSVYGTTTNSDGNSPGEGIVYQLKRAATGNAFTFRVLHKFSGNNGGKDPESGVVVAPNGDLYGLSGGSSTTPGTLFKLTPNAAGTVWTHKVLHLFVVPADGRYPTGTLALDSAGTLYGVTNAGGLLGTNFQYGGVAFSFTPPSTYKVIYRFLAKPDDGFAPLAGPTLRGGVLFGTTSGGGAKGDGTLYRLLKTTGTWTEVVLHPFNGPTEGSALRGPLLPAGPGFYGTARSEGARNGGTVFLIAPP